MLRLVGLFVVLWFVVFVVVLWVQVVVFGWVESRSYEKYRDDFDLTGVGRLD